MTVNRTGNTLTPLCAQGQDEPARGNWLAAQRLRLVGLLIGHICLILMISSGLSPINQAYADERLIILIRHAETAPQPSEDPRLAAAGEIRAIALITALQRTPLSQVVATQFQRTQQTVAPLAKVRHLPVTALSAKLPLQVHIQDMVEQVHAVKGNTLIAGHSNTLPLIIKALGGPEINPIAADDYSQLFLLSINPGQPASLISTRYGQE
ncbi:MAG: histidine phosphatase family protein [Shewanella sp.]